MPRSDRQMAYRPPRERKDKQAATFAECLRFLRTYAGPHWLMITLCVMLESASACSVYLMAYYGRVVVDRVLVISAALPPDDADDAESRHITATDRGPAAHRPPGHGGLSEASRAMEAPLRPPRASSKLVGLFVLYALTILALNLAARGTQRTHILVAKSITAHLREDVHRKMLSLSRSYHQAHTPGRLMARVLSDVDAVQQQLMATIILASSSVITFAVGVAIVCALDWRIAAAAACVMIPYSLSVRRSHTRIQATNQELRHTNACLWGLVSQKLDSIRAILAYRGKRHEYLAFHRLSASLLRDAVEQSRLGARLSRTAQILTSLTTVGIFLYCTLRVTAGVMTLGKMMYIYGASASLFTPVLQLTQVSLTLSSLLVLVARLTHVLDEPLAISDAPGAVPFPVPLHAGIDVRHVTFGFGDAEEPVLRDLDFRIKAGRWLCIMGPSGSGKSTLLHLLARLYDPTSGEILVDGIFLPNIRLQSIRNEVALVPQEAQIFSGTVRDNITYGRPGAEPSEIMAAAEAADCHGFIMDLPVQYETVVGEKGTTLSGGQRQRISIARALITRPQVLLLDDCTSALDAATEQHIQETLLHLMGGRTAVIVSQRVSMAMRCQRTIVLETGGVTEEGTHDELLANGGFYSRLYAQQTA